MSFAMSGIAAIGVDPRGILPRTPWSICAKKKVQEDVA